MRFLIIVAHPDDEVLAMGGTIKKLTKSGHDVKIVFMATGISARRSLNYKNSSNYNQNKIAEETMKKQIQILRKDAKRSQRY